MHPRMVSLFSKISHVDIYINNKLSLAAEQEHGDDLRYLALNLHITVYCSLWQKPSETVLTVGKLRCL
jgi:hypothetical protein